MDEREKVIEGLESVKETLEIIRDKQGVTWVANAIALLKAQEHVMVEERADSNTINCPKCGQQFARVGRDKSVYLDTDEEPNYCPKCGQAVKWDD